MLLPCNLVTLVLLTLSTLKAPFLPRLGLLAVATSNGVVTIYSLPHPEALHSNKKLPNSGKTAKIVLLTPHAQDVT